MINSMIFNNIFLVNVFYKLLVVRPYSCYKVQQGIKCVENNEIKVKKFPV